jgi:hypothetical protein
MEKKNVVLVYGTWHGGWYWRRVKDILSGKGHRVFSPTLTGLGERSPLQAAAFPGRSRLDDRERAVRARCHGRYAGAAGRAFGCVDLGVDPCSVNRLPVK